MVDDRAIAFLESHVSATVRHAVHRRLPLGQLDPVYPRIATSAALRLRFHATLCKKMTDQTQT